MPTPSKVRDLDEVLAWIAEGRTYRWMSEEYLRRYGVETTSAMWAQIRRRHGLGKRIVHDAALMPWWVAPEHRHAHAASMLRAEGRRRAGLVLSERVARNLDRWIERMRAADEVVFYDRSVGWRSAPRRGGVDLDLIREPRTSDNAPRTTGNITSSVWITHENGACVPFDSLLLSSDRPDTAAARRPVTPTAPRATHDASTGLSASAPS